MNSLDKNIELVRQILTQAIKLSTSTIIDVFVDFASHTKGLSVRVILEGWKEESTTDYSKTIYIDWPNSEKDLQEVLNYLETLKGGNLK